MPSQTKSAEYKRRARKTLKENNRCVRCKKERDPNSKVHCTECALWMREYARKKAGCKPRVEGGTGRPIKIGGDSCPSHPAP